MIGPRRRRTFSLSLLAAPLRFDRRSDRSGDPIGVLEPGILVGDPDDVGCRRCAPHRDAPPRVPFPCRTGDEQDAPFGRRATAREPHGSGGAAHTTNQRMEVQAVLEALQSVPGELTIVSDSTYVVNCFRDRWYVKWQRNGWKNSKKEPVANCRPHRSARPPWAGSCRP